MSSVAFVTTFPPNTATGAIANNAAKGNIKMYGRFVTAVSRLQAMNHVKGQIGYAVTFHKVLRAHYVFCAKFSATPFDQQVKRRMPSAGRAFYFNGAYLYTVANQEVDFHFRAGL